MPATSYATKIQNRPIANAWSRPLQQQSNYSSFKTRTKMSKPSTPPKAETNEKLNAIRDRFLYIIQNMVGQNVTVTLVNGTIIEGVFHTFTPFESSTNKNKYVIKACRVIKHEDDISYGSTAIISSEKVSSVLVKSMRMENARTTNGGEFKTDVEISGSIQGKKDFDLIAADSAWTTPNQDLVTNSRFDALRSPNKSYNLNGNIGAWDQFTANEQLFSVKASFDENIYTTELDKTTMDDSQIREAERLAKEIEGSVSTNMHIAEERGQKVEGDYFDEEDKYSGVLRNNVGAWKTRPSTTERKPKEEAPATPTPKEPTPTPEPTKPKMNYASVAAAAVKNNNINKPKIPIKKVVVVPVEKPTPTEATPEVSSTPETEKEVKTETEEIKEEPKPEEKKKPVSKLNANAKEFTFNPNATSFTPSQPAPEVQMPPPYMHHHPQMVPMTQFVQGNRYQNYYPQPYQYQQVISQQHILQQPVQQPAPQPAQQPAQPQAQQPAQPQAQQPTDDNEQKNETTQQNTNTAPYVQQPGVYYTPNQQVRTTQQPQQYINQQPSQNIVIPNYQYTRMTYPHHPHMLQPHLVHHPIPPNFYQNPIVQQQFMMEDDSYRRGRGSANGRKNFNRNNKQNKKGRGGYTSQSPTTSSAGSGNIEDQKTTSDDGVKE